MKTLKEELQAILDKKKLSNDEFICRNLSWDNRELLEPYKEMASNYAEEYFSGRYAWWGNYGSYGEKYQYVLSEKYRFIQDLIKILP